MANEAIDITPEDSVVPVYLVPLTEEEIAEREQWAADAAQREIDEAAKAEKKAAVLAAIAKATGLTKEDITDALA